MPSLLGKNNKKRIAIIGGGVSGVAAALSFPHTYQVDIFEREDRLLKKLLKTGNGKANIFNLTIKPTSYNHPDFIQLHPDMIEKTQAFYRELGILTFIDEEGRGYPFSRSAKALAITLVSSLGKQVNVHLSTNVDQIEIKENGISINGQRYDYLILTTGSSVYNQNVDLENNNTSLLSSLGLNVTKLYPTSGPLMIQENLRSIENEKVLASLTIYEKDRFISEEEGEILFKRDSLSGIASFISSSYLIWDYRQTKTTDYTFYLNLIKDREVEVESLLKTRPVDQEIFKGVFSDNLNQYLYSKLDKKAKLPQVMLLLTHLSFRIAPDFILTQDKGQLMNGGVDLSEINTHTFALNAYPNIYLGGEVLDVDGISGGYNLMFALYSGITISNGIINK
jgi:hypothetical protein